MVVVDTEGRVVGLEELPQHPRSHYAVTGLYFYDNQVVDIAAQLKPSVRGELEITDVNQTYLDRGSLRVRFWGRGMAWLDMGTPDSLLEAANFIEVVERRQGLKIGCVEEVAYHMGYIDDEQLSRLAHEMTGSSYGDYLFQILNPRGTHET